MSFQSLSYFVFLPIVAVLYLKVIPARLQTGFLLAFSLLFYWFNRPASAEFSGAWQALPLCLLLVASFVLWRLGLAMQAADAKRKKRLMAAGIVYLLAVLAVFKYYNLLLAAPVFAPAALHRLPFPLGISFYTFSGISYLVDVAHGDINAEERFGDLAAYLTFFGSISAGPICRAGKILPQLKQAHSFDAARTVRTLQLFALGLFKKVAVADVLYLYLVPVFSDISGHGAPSLILAVLAYTFYLYFDFVGYSEMARASALLLGIELPENFKTPFFATNFSGFWSRWHISLSGWLQDYIFTPLVWADASKIPLLGRKISRLSPVFCVFCVFFVSGFWHGNTLPFVVWGLLQGIYRAGEELLHKRLGKPKKKAPKRVVLGKRLGVFLLWTFSMVFFAVGSGVGGTGTMADVGALFAGMTKGWAPSRFLSETWQAVLTGFYAESRMAAAFILFIIFTLALSFWLDWQRFARFKGKSAETVLAGQTRTLRWVLYYVLVLCIFAGFILQSGGFGGGSFAYANF